jgi:hypothetical protein
VKRATSRLSLPPNDTALGVVETRQAPQQGPYVFYSLMNGGRIHVKGALDSAIE